MCMLINKNVNAKLIISSLRRKKVDLCKSIDSHFFMHLLYTFRPSSIVLDFLECRFDFFSLHTTLMKGALQDSKIDYMYDLYYLFG